MGNDRKNKKDKKNNNPFNKKGKSPFPPFNDDDQGKYFGIFLVILLVVFAFLFFTSTPNEMLISYSGFLNHVENDSLSQVVIEGQTVRGTFKTELNGKKTFKTIIPMEDPGLLQMLREHRIDVVGEKTNNAYGGNLMWWLIIISVVMFIFWIVMMRGLQGGGEGGRTMNFSKSKARLHKESNMDIKFKDVAGCEEAKEDLEEVVDFLKNQKKFTKIGARIPKGILLVGSPGTGKTLLAKAVAGEANVPFFSVSGSEFVEMFVGVGAARVRDLFVQGRKNAPCIIFIDELDAVGRSRGAGLGGSHDEREQTLNQILVEMDGFDSSEGLIMLAATNRPDILDPALTRPGRFDREIVVDKPDVKAREAILKIHSDKIKLLKATDLNLIARGTPGFTGADLENLVNEAALKAARDGRESVTLEDLEYAKDKVMMGAERKNSVISNEDKTVTAYHESGHAILGHLLPLADPVHKVTIIPRGRALGLTHQLPVDERKGYTKSHLQQILIVLMGGRAAENVKFGNQWISTGASNDIERATQIANSMVCEWGMSEILGPVSYGEKEGPVFLGKDIMNRKNYSEKVHEIIDEEVKRIIGESYQKALDLLEKNREVLDELANKLLKDEVLNAEEVSNIVGKTDKQRYPILELLGISPVDQLNEEFDETDVVKELENSGNNEDVPGDEESSNDPDDGIMG